MRVDLHSGTPASHQHFVTKVAEQAIEDEHAGRRGKTGRELCDMFANDYRRGHLRLASGLYNKLRWSIKLATAEH